MPGSTHSSTINFSCKAPVGGQTALFAVSRDTANHGSRTFVVKTADQLMGKDHDRYDTNLRSAVDALNSVDKVRVKSAARMEEFGKTVDWVNRKVDRHNNNGFKTFLKFLGIPWLLATLFDSDFFKTFEHVKVGHGISVGFSDNNYKAHSREKKETFFNQVMSKLEQNENIVELDFTNYELTSKDVDKLVVALGKNSTVRSLILTQPKTGYALSKDDLKRVCDAVAKHPTIESISFQDYPVTDGKMEVIGGLLRQKRDIKELNLSNTHLTAQDAKILRESLGSNHGLRTLDLYWNNLYSDGAKEVAGILNANPQLTTLDIGYNALGKTGTISWSQDGVSTLANAVGSHTGIQKLDVRYNALGDDGCELFGRALQMNTSVTWFDTSWNNFGPKAAVAFGAAMGDHPRLEHISFYWNDMQSRDIVALGKGIGKSHSLQYVDLGASSIDQDQTGYAYLKEAVAASETPRSIRYSSIAKPWAVLASVLDPRGEVLSWDDDLGVITNQ